MAEIEYAVAKKKDLSDGQMQPINVGEPKIMLVLLNREFYAVVSIYPHYGARLEKRLLHEISIFTQYTTYLPLISC